MCIRDRLYAVLPSYPLMLGLVIVHGCFWSGLLVAASSYVTDIVPPHRRAEGMSYWGMSTIFAVSMAPAIGLWVYEHGGWQVLCFESAALCLGMFTIALTLLPKDTPHVVARAAWSWSSLIEWKVLALSITMFLYSFGYGGITSFVAMYSDASGVHPASLYFTVFSIAILVTRPYVARLGDRIGHKKVLVPCLALVVAGFALLAVGGSTAMFVVSALVFGTGFGSAYPLCLGHVMRHVAPERRGAAFGSIIAAFDTGIGTGSMAIGFAKCMRACSEALDLIMPLSAVQRRWRRSCVAPSKTLAWMEAQSIQNCLRLPVPPESIRPDWSCCGQKPVVQQAET